MFSPSTQYYVMAGVKVTVIATLIVVNMAIYNGNIRFPSNTVVNNVVEGGFEEPTATVIPTATAANHVEHVIQQRFDKRSQSVRRVCEAKGSRAAGVTKPVELFDVPSIGLLWCPTFKAGSSNWLDLFCKAKFNHPLYQDCDVSKLRENNPTTKYTQVRAEDFTYSNKMKNELGIPFMTVRNPLARFVSAYRDKWEWASSKSYYFDRSGQEIVKQYRSVGLHLSDEEKEDLLAAAAKIIHHQTQRDLTLDEITANPYLNPPGPTFKEFVKWALNGGMDLHFMPFYQSCAPCAIDYNILRLEKLNEESGYLFSFIERSYLNLDFRMSQSTHSKTETCLNDYFRTISRHDLQALYGQLFKVDCELYGYPCKEILRDIISQPKASQDIVKC